MKPDFLHRFIHALDKGEVNACRTSEHLNSGKWADQRLTLFNALLSMEKYDQDRLVLMLDHPQFVRSLSNEKYRLYRALLHTVTDLRMRREDGDRAWACISESRVLLGLGMPDEACVVTLEGIEEAARVHDLFAELQLREQLRRLYKALPRKDNITRVTDNEYRLETVVLQVRNLQRYTAICDRLDDYQSRYRMADDMSIRAAMDGLRSDPLMADIDRAMSLPAQIRFASAHAFLAHAEGDLPQAAEHMELCLSLWESCPDRIAHVPSQYRQAVANYMGILNLIGERTLLPVLLKKLEQVPVKDRRDAVLAFGDVELQYQLFHINSGEPEKVVERGDIVLNGLRRFGKLVRESRQITLLFNLGVAHLITGNSASAKNCFNRIHDMGQSPARIDLQGLARMMRLLLILEDDIGERFQHFLRNNRRVFRKGMPFYRMEDIVHRWLTAHYKDYHTHSRKEALMSLHVKLQPFEEQKLPGAEEIRLWTLSRASGRPIMDILGERKTQ